MSAAVELTREPHPDPGNSAGRIRYFAYLMAGGQWVDGITSVEAAEDWRISPSTARGYAAQASNHLKLLGERDSVMALVRLNAARWMDAGDQDRVPAAKLLLETVGGIVQRHEHKHEVSQRSDAELFAMMLAEVRSDPVLRAKAIAFLTAESPDVALLTEGMGVSEQ